MSILHPSIFYLALACALGPLVIHLLTRLRHRREPWAAMQFLIAAHAQIRRRLHLRHYLMLALRTAAIILLGLALSRPGATDAWMLPGGAGSKCARIILLDDTLSMQAHHEGNSNSFAAAKSFIENLLHDFPANSPTALMTLSSRKSQPQRLVAYPTDLLTALQSTEATFKPSDLEASLRSAGKLLADTRDAWESSRVYFVSDLDHAAIEQLNDLARHPDLLDAVGQLLIANVGPRHRDNVAISAIRRESEIVAPMLPVRYAVEVANYSKTDLTGVELKISSNAQVRHNIPIGPIPSGGRIIQSFELTFAKHGPQRIIAELADATGDALPADNLRFLCEHIPDRINALLVEGQAGLPDPQQELFYVRTAVRVFGNPSQPLIQAKSILPQQIDAEVLDDHAVVILGDVANMGRATADRLSRFVENGGGLIVFRGEQPIAGTQRLLPVELDRFETVDESADALSLMIAEPDHSVISDFVSSAGGGLTSVHVNGRWRTRPVDENIGVRTLLDYSDRRPAVILSSRGRGRIVSVTTGANMQWTNLPAKPDFVPLILNLISFAAGGNVGTASVEIEQPIAMAVDSHEAVREHLIQRPDSRSARGSIELHDGRTTLIYADTDRPGIYSARLESKRLECAVNVNPVESDLRTTELTSLLQGSNGRVSLIEPKPQTAARASQADRRELSGLFMILLLLVVLIETLMARWFGRRA